MNLKQFVAELAEQGVKLWTEGDQLRVRAAKGVLTPELRDELALHKAELVKLLQHSNTSASDTDVPLVRVSRTGNLLPISLSQLEFWIAAQLHPDVSLHDDIPLAYRLTGSLNVTALEQASVEIVRRHEALRTTFVIMDGQVVQKISPEPVLTFSVVDLQEFSASKTEREALAQQLVTEEEEKPFNLTQDPLLRIKLLQLDEAEHVFIVAIPHIVYDGSSMGVFLQELRVLYKAFCNTQPSLQDATSYRATALRLASLPELPIQYGDFALWQQQWLMSKDFLSHLDYWKQQLGGSLHVLQLPTDRERAAVETLKGADHSLPLPLSLTNALKVYSQQQNVTLFVTLLTVFKILLFHYSGQSDIIVGAPFANRQKAETKELIGCFINTFPLRTNLGGNPSFQQLLFRVRSVVLAALDHQEVPVFKLVEALQPKRDASNWLRHPVLFNFMSSFPALELSNLTVLPWSMGITRLSYDLYVQFFEYTSGNIEGSWCYDCDLFDAATMTRMANQFLVLLESIVTNPDQRLADLSLLIKQDNAKCSAINPQYQVNTSIGTTPSKSSDSVIFIKPRTPTEEAIAAIWCDVLGLELVGIHDNFFELGGHSLRAIQTISQLRDTFKVELPLRLLFEEPTVAALAQNIENLIISNQKQP